VKQTKWKWSMKVMRVLAMESSTGSVDVWTKY